MKIRLSAVALLTLLAACGEETYTRTRGGSQSPSEWTGLLIDAQRPPSKMPFKSTLDQWKVVDPAGNTLFSDQDVPASNLRATVWAFRRNDVEGLSNRQALGENPFEIKVMDDKYSGDFKSGTFTVSDATAAEIRGKMTLVKTLLRRWSIVILVGKIGE